MNESGALSFDEYAERSAAPCFTEWLRQRSEPEWMAATEHPFTRELGAGTLDADAFAAYLVQDYAFVNDLVGAFGRAIGDAPTMTAMRRLVRFLDTITDEENDYFQRSFEALDVSEDRRTDPELHPVIEAFIDLLGRASREGGYAETLAVLVPAEWIYEEWATSVADAYELDPLPFYYREWVELHSVSEFVGFVAWLRTELDDIGPSLSPDRQDHVARMFGRTVELEVAFFDAAYGEGE